MRKPLEVDHPENIKYLKADDKCYYFMEYTSGAGYKYSSANNTVINYKKDIEYRGSPAWDYRNEAIDDFASMLHSTLRGRECTVIPCPTSKSRTSEFYNDRLDQTAMKLGRLSSNYDIQLCLETITDQTAAHYGGSRDPSAIKNFTVWTQPIITLKATIILFDDVLTSGAHFRAYKDMVLEKCPNSKVIGIFLAKARSIDDDIPSVELPF